MAGGTSGADHVEIYKPGYGSLDLIGSTTGGFSAEKQCVPVYIFVEVLIIILGS